MSNSRLIFIPQTTLACGGSYLAGKEYGFTAGVRARCTLGLGLSISLPLTVLLQSTNDQRLSGPPYGKPPYVLEGCQGIQKLAMR